MDYKDKNMNINKSIGVVGNGFVGGAIIHAFSNDWQIKIYDKNINKRTHDLKETIDQDIIFLCLPTPMTDVEGGECNLSILEEAVDNISSINKRKDNIYVIKSTVPIGTTEKLQNKHKNLNIVHSPEFLTARSARLDFITSPRHIIGIPNINNNVKKYDWLNELYNKRFTGSLIINMDSNESEFVKYACNCFFATKVMYFNEIKLLADKLGLNWETIMDGIMSDNRIAKSHTSVPGHDGDRGFGGTCFPKDINALIRTMEEHNIDPMVLKSVWEQNKNVRENWDWANSESAVMPSKSS